MTEENRSTSRTTVKMARVVSASVSNYDRRSKASDLGKISSKKVSSKPSSKFKSKNSKRSTTSNKSSHSKRIGKKPHYISTFKKVEDLKKTRKS